MHPQPDRSRGTRSSHASPRCRSNLTCEQHVSPVTLRLWVLHVLRLHALEGGTTCQGFPVDCDQRNFSDTRGGDVGVGTQIYRHIERGFEAIPNCLHQQPNTLLFTARPPGSVLRFDLEKRSCGDETMRTKRFEQPSASYEGWTQTTSTYVNNTRWRSQLDKP